MEWDELRPGDVLSGRWLLSGVIGAGGAATVYEATGLWGERAAVKMMRVDALMAPGALTRFLREGVFARRIRHPAMVRALGEGTTDDGRPYVALELLEGEPLDWLARRRPRLPAAWILEAIDPVLDLLSHCHEEGTVHRDVKPANVFLLRNGGAKLLDFGLARARDLSDDFVRPGVSLGTPSFMAPEQAMGAWDQVDARSDVFSVGATLFALLTGTRLHASRTEAVSFTLAATQAAPSLGDVEPTLHPSLIQVVDRALCWDKRSRFQDAAELRRALRAVRAQLAPHAPIEVLHSPARDDGEDTPTFAPLARSVSTAFALLERLIDAPPASSDDRSWMLRHASEQLQHAVARGTEPLRIEVLSWCVRVAGSPMWIPREAGAALPYALFEDGLRAFELSPSTTADDLLPALRVLVARLRGDEATQDGPVVAIQRVGAPGLVLDVTVSLASDPAEAPEQVLDALRVAERIVAGAHRVKCRASDGVWSQGAERVRRVAGDRRLRVLREAWARAHQSPDAGLVQALQTAMDEARASGGDEHAWEAIGRAADDLLARGRPDLLVRALQPFDEAGRDAARHLLRGQRVGRLVRTAAALQQAGAARNAAAGSLSEGPSHEVLRSLLDEADATGVPGVLQQLPSLNDEGIEREAVAYVRRFDAPPLPVLTEVLPALSGEAGTDMVLWLAEQDGSGPRSVLERLASMRSKPLALAASVQLCGVTREAETLAEQLLASADAAERVLAIRAAQASGMAALVPTLAAHAGAHSFHRRSARERRLTLDCLLRLAPATAEGVACSLIRKHGLLRDDALNATRLMAASLLEEDGSTQESVEALRTAEVPTWWNPPEVRVAAQRARAAVEARLAATRRQHEEP